MNVMEMQRVLKAKTIIKNINWVERCKLEECKREDAVSAELMEARRFFMMWCAVCENVCV